jgi:hypothetical protein
LCHWSLLEHNLYVCIKKERAISLMGEFNAYYAEF